MAKKNKILITGVCAQQYSAKAGERAQSFASTLQNVYETLGYDVSMAMPSLDWTPEFLGQHKHVFIGIAPLLSVTANGAYGALGAVDALLGSPNMTMFCDTPAPWKVFANLRAIDKDSESLFKPFYRQRPQFSRVSASGADRERVLRGAQKLIDGSWNKTIYPALPWSPPDVQGIPAEHQSSFVPAKIDAVTIDTQVAYNAKREKRWLIENEKSKWATSTVTSLCHPADSVKSLKLRRPDEITAAMKHYTGVIIAPHDDKTTWWSPRYSQALNACTPIVTDWKISQTLGAAWSLLAASVEDMLPVDHYELAIAQKISYISSMPTVDEVISQLQGIVGAK